MIGERIRDMRIARRMTQEALAAEVGTDARTIWRYESGKTTPSASMLQHIAIALNTTTDYLSGMTDDPYPSDTPLSPSERALVSALRRGDKLGAIEIIVKEHWG